MNSAGNLHPWPDALETPWLAAFFVNPHALTTYPHMVLAYCTLFVHACLCPPAVQCHVADVLVRRLCGEAGGELGEQSPSEVRVAIIGNVDSGKSTMVGVLTRSMLDDGRGLARSKVQSLGLCIISKFPIAFSSLFHSPLQSPAR